VVKPEWGRRRACVKCGTKFYDMRRSPAKCPSCGTVAELPAARTGERKSAPPSRPAKPLPDAEVFEGPELEIDDLETDIDDSDLDADELPDDPAEMP